MWFLVLNNEYMMKKQKKKSGSNKVKATREWMIEHNNRLVTSFKRCILYNNECVLYNNEQA